MQKKYAFLLGIAGIASILGVATFSNGNLFRSDLTSTGTALPQSVKIGAYYTPVFSENEADITNIFNTFPGRTPLVSNAALSSDTYLSQEIATAKSSKIDFFVVDLKTPFGTQEQNFLDKIDSLSSNDFAYSIAVDASTFANSASVQLDVSQHLQKPGYLKDKNNLPVIYIRNIEALVKQLDNTSLIQGTAFPKTKERLDLLKNSLNATIIPIDDFTLSVGEEAPFDEETYMEAYSDIKGAVQNGALQSAYQHYQITDSSEHRIKNASYVNYFKQYRLPQILLEKFALLGISATAQDRNLTTFENTQKLGFYSAYRKSVEQSSNSILNAKSSVSVIPSLLVGWNPTAVVSRESLPTIIEGNTPEEFEELGEYLATFIQQQKTTPEFMLINSWNNYGMMEPLTKTRRWADAYLKTVSRIKDTISKELLIPKNKTKTVMILGDSLTLHPPLADPTWDGLAWNGNWGMAASNISKDYVHQTEQILNSQGTPIRTLLPGRDFPSGGGTVYGFLSPIQKYNMLHMRPDIIVIQLSENAEIPADPNLSELESFNKQMVALQNNYKALLAYINSTVKVPVFSLGSWSENSDETSRNAIIKNLDAEYGATFVSILNAVNDPHAHNTAEQIPALDSHTSEGLKNGILWHPGDVGMRKIAEALAAALTTKL